jgi:DnaJ-class molecular chaperone
MHAEKCPICSGTGLVYPDTNMTGDTAKKTCNGCHGRGWIEVND